jgi:hypothetical protein
VKPVGENDNVFRVLRLFLPETTLEQWATDGRVDVKDGRLTVGSENTSFALTRAVHFCQLVSGTDDQRLLAKVKTLVQLQQLGAEQMRESVIIGEAAYEVVPGYVTELLRKTGDAKGEAESEADLLASFLLNKMR